MSKMSKKDKIIVVSILLLICSIPFLTIGGLFWLFSPTHRYNIYETVVVEEAYRYQDSGFLTSTSDKIVVFWNSSYEDHREFDPQDTPDVLRLTNGSHLCLTWEISEYRFTDDDRSLEKFTILS